MQENNVLVEEITVELAKGLEEFDQAWVSFE